MGRTQLSKHQMASGASYGEEKGSKKCRHSSSGREKVPTLFWVLFWVFPTPFCLWTRRRRVAISPDKTAV